MDDRTGMALRTEELATEIATEVTGHTPSKTRRFTTGARHYVFEVQFADRSPVFVRIGVQSARTEIDGAILDRTPVDVVQTALTARRDHVDRIEPTPFLHDTTTKNVIVTPDENFSGIVDVDDLCFGDPRYPAALTLAVLLAYGGPVEYVSAWLRHAQKPDDPTFRLYVAVFLLDLMAEHGQVFNGNERPSAPEERASLRQAFQYSLQLAMA